MPMGLGCRCGRIRRAREPGVATRSLHRATGGSLTFAPLPPHRDLVAANLIEAGEKALVLNSGYFGDAFADCFEAYGIKADQVGAPVGGRPAPADIEAALKKDKYAVLTFTHVDTCKLFAHLGVTLNADRTASRQPPVSSPTRRALRRL